MHNSYTIFYTKFIFYVNSLQYDHLITVETIMITFLHKRDMFYTCKLNFILLLSHSLVNISTTNITEVASMLFSQCQRNAKEHTLTQLSFSAKYQCRNNIGSSTLNRNNSFNVVSTLLCQQSNSFDKHTSAHFSFSTKFLH